MGKKNARTIVNWRVIPCSAKCTIEDFALRKIDGSAMNLWYADKIKSLESVRGCAGMDDDVIDASIQKLKEEREIIRFEWADIDKTPKNFCKCTNDSEVCEYVVRYLRTRFGFADDADGLLQFARLAIQNAGTTISVRETCRTKGEESFVYSWAKIRNAVWMLAFNECIKCGAISWRNAPAILVEKWHLGESKKYTK